MFTGVEGLGPVQGLTTVEPTGPSENLVNIKELGHEFEQNVFGEAQNPEGEVAGAAEQPEASASDSIGGQLVATMDGLNAELESTIQEVMRLISKKPNQAELLQLQLKATQLFITHELSSKIVSKATNSVDRLVQSQ